MVIAPRVRGFICTTAHPNGCAENVKQQIAYVKQQNKAITKPLKVLVIGASTGYGLASRIVASFLANAQTIGVSFERSALAQKTASPGWYNTVAFEQEASAAGIYAKSINGDAFSAEIKQQTIDLIKQDWGTVDLVVYSLAAPRRVAQDGTIYNSVLKPVGDAYRNKTIDFNSGKISEVEIAPANQDELTATTKVMGGEDLQHWVQQLSAAKVLANNCQIVAYSYIGPEITYPVYRNGTIGHAKEHLETTVQQINQFLQQNYNGRAVVSVNKALVTQASSAIPVVPLYISLLYKIMKQKDIHEGCIEQIFRLFTDYLYADGAVQLDEAGRIRIDDLEMREDVQQEINNIWGQITQDNINQFADLTGYKQEFYNLFGFEFENIDYTKDCQIDLAIPSIVEYAE
jgi:enoyl-[acyl-carrier protein] reductase/trans-2-enoyl-CoA reductase (NAD+)